MSNKKAQVNKMLVALIIAIVALVVFLMFYTGQWQKLVSNLTSLEEAAIQNSTIK